MKLKPIIAAISVALLSTAAQAAQRYAVTTLLDNAYPSDINNNGQVVGTYYTYHLYQSNLYENGSGGFLYSGGTITRIVESGYTHASGINDSGQVVGGHTGGGYFDPSYTFLYRDGSMTDIGTLGGRYNYASAINASGQIAGHASPADDSAIQAVLYSDGKTTLLFPPGNTYSLAFDINDSGQIVGYKEGVSWDAYQAFLYSDGDITDLGTLGGISSAALAINASGQIVGYSKTDYGRDHAFVYSDGTMTDLGSLGDSSRANGINDSGQIVGSTDTDSGVAVADHAFLYTDGAMVDLNSLIDPLPDWVITSASGINNSGQIIARAEGPGDSFRAFLLTPVPVPEPATYAMLLAGLGLVGGQAWRRSMSTAKKTEA